MGRRNDSRIDKARQVVRSIDFRQHRCNLALTTALTTTLAALLLTAPLPARADQALAIVASPVAVLESSNVDCVFSGDCILISTVNDGSSIDLAASGFLIAGDDGIATTTSGSDAAIRIENDGRIEAGVIGIHASTSGSDSGITIINSGDIAADNGILNSGFPFNDIDNGIDARTTGPDSGVRIVNSGDIASGYDGIYVLNTGGGSPVRLTNTGTITTGDRSDATSDGGEAIDLRAYTAVAPAPIPAEIPVPDALKVGPGFSPVTLINHGVIISDDDGIEVCTAGLAGTNCRGGGGNSPVLVVNTATIIANYVSLDSVTYGPDSPIIYFNSGLLISNEESIDAETSGDGSAIEITNSGDVTSGIDGVSAATGAYAAGDNSPITVFNTGDIIAGEVGIYTKTAQNFAGDFSPIAIENHGNIQAGLNGIYTVTNGIDSDITIVNSGDISSKKRSAIYAVAGGSGSGVRIETSGVLRGKETGIFAHGEGIVQIFNSGEISAVSGRAIDTGRAGHTEITNTGLITGRLDLSNGWDFVFNRSSGTFEARGDSQFRDEYDGFANHGLVHAADGKDQRETVRFNGLENFFNYGRLSLVDGGAGDRFIVSGAFHGQDGGIVELEAALDGPGAPTDTIRIHDALGRNGVVVTNVGTTGGAPTSVGIVLVDIEGEPVDRNFEAKNFFLANGPVDAGFFDYELFFRRVGFGAVFELRSSIGAGALLLPQLLTSGQDIWHEGSAAWSDRMADLRSALNAADRRADRAAGGPLPGLWIAGSTAELSREDDASTSAHGRSHQLGLDRELDLQQVQIGLDTVQRGVRQAGDTLVLGLLTGGLRAGLDYETVEREFDIEGWQLGAYASYLTGGLHLGGLVKADLFGIESDTPGFQGGLDGSSVGVRVDGGYRLGTGSFHVEPLATLAATFVSIDSLTSGPNTVTFEDGTSVRGRLGLRVGTAINLSGTASIEPYLIASVWSEVAGDNNATLVSLGQQFDLTDSQDEVWGELSAGVDVLSEDAMTAAFAKIDVTVGAEIEGIAGKLGATVKW